MIPEDKILEIRQKANIVDIIGSYVDLEKKGKNHFALCPFHDDTNPSMSVSEEKQIFNCFTCNIGGNVFSFVMEYDNVDFKTAVKTVADKVGVPLEITKSYQKSYDSVDYKILDVSKKFFYNNLNTKIGLKAKQYLLDRNIDEETIKFFELGYAQDEYDSLTNFLTKQNYKEKDLLELGLTNQAETSLYDAFRNRIIIPIDNLDGKTVGFTGRIFNNEDLAKYVNSKESNIFKKGNILFNYFNAKNHIKKTKFVLLVEGNMDVIKLHSSGIYNSIALMGTSLTKEQITALKKLRCQLKLLLDSDTAGIEATIRYAEELIKNKIDVSIIKLNDAKDPDEFIDKFGVEKFKIATTKDISFIDYKIEYLKKKYNLKNTEELSEFIKEVIKSLEHLNDIEQELVLSKISKDYQVDIDILRKQLKPTAKKETIQVKVKEESQQEISRYKQIANIVLYYLLNDYNFSRIYKDDLNYFKEKSERELFAAIYSYQKNNKNYVVADFLIYIHDNNELYEKTISILNEHNTELVTHDKFIQYVDAMKKYLKEELIKELTFKINNETNDDEKIKLLLELTEIKREG